jgi:hypothetical protein
MGWIVPTYQAILIINVEKRRRSHPDGLLVFFLFFFLLSTTLRKLNFDSTKRRVSPGGGSVFSFVLERCISLHFWVGYGGRWRLRNDSGGATGNIPP